MDILFNYLYDYQDIVALHPIPMTKLKQEMIQDNMSIYEKFLFHKDCRYNINLTEEYTPIKLYNNFLYWYDNMGLNKNFKPSKMTFFKEISKFGKSKQIRKKKNVNKKRERTKDTACILQRYCTGVRNKYIRG